LEKNFKQLGFETYLDGNVFSNRVIVQLESLMKLDSENPFMDTDEVIEYDTVLIDESESILNHFSSSKTFDHKEREVFQFLYKVLQKSKKIITLDGDQNNRTYAFTESLGKCIHLENTAVVHNHEIMLYEDYTQWKKNLLDDAQHNRRFVCASMSASLITSLHEELVKSYPKKKFAIYTSGTGDVEKTRDAKNVTEAWSRCDGVLYSPTIESGVNFDVPGHFQKIYGILCAKSTVQRAFYQMINRVRHFDDPIIRTFKGDIPDQHTHAVDFWNYEDVKTGMMSIKKRDTLDPYEVNSIYNKVEELNKHSYYFMPYFKNLGMRKGISSLTSNRICLQIVIARRKRRKHQALCPRHKRVKFILLWKHRMWKTWSTSVNYWQNNAVICPLPRMCS
jgi:hypothetical protein